jgi:hypothetical protein
MRNVCKRYAKDLQRFEAIMADAVLGRDLLAQAKAAGLNVRAVGERLSVRGPRIHEALIRRLVEQKADILAALASACHPEAASTPGLPSSPLLDDWDETRAIDVQGIVNTRIDIAVAAIPADHPRRQARLNILENEGYIVAGLMAKHDPILWGWLDSLERLLKRWDEEDQAILWSKQP